MPFSISSTRIRLALVRLDFASDLTRRAVPGGRFMLWRTGLSAVDMTQEYTNVHHDAPGCQGSAFPLNRSSRLSWHRGPGCQCRQLSSLAVRSPVSVRRVVGTLRRNAGPDR